MITIVHGMEIYHSLFIAVSVFLLGALWCYLVGLTNNVVVLRQGCHKNFSCNFCPTQLTMPEGSNGDSFKYKNYTIQDQFVFNLSQLENKKKFFITLGDHKCYIEGTLTINSITGCHCAPNYFGKWCSFPDILHYSKLLNLSLLKPRTQPRRVVCLSPFNNELELLDGRFGELGDIIDLFMFSESNYSGHGDPKRLILLDELQKGYAGTMQSKIAHVFYGYFPKDGYKNGWIADDLHWNVLDEGLKRQVIGARHDDLLFTLDSDELPKREIVLFLKLHDGYTEPIRISLDKRIYGFFWRTPKPTVISFACTFGFLWHIYESHVLRVRNPDRFIKLGSISAYTYLKIGGKIRSWTIGDQLKTMGWHCSWCKDPEGIRTKLVSAVNADFPRWGDYPHKQKIDYIKSLIQKGLWFDDTTAHLKVNPDILVDYAPKYMIENWNRYRYLLINPYREV